MKLIQKIGLVIFIASLAVFIGALSMSDFKVTEEIVNEKFDTPERKANFLAVADGFIDKQYTSKFEFFADFEAKIIASNERLLSEKGITEAELDAVLNALPEAGKYDLSALDAVFDEASAHKKKALSDNTSWMVGRDYADNAAIKVDLMSKLGDINNGIIKSNGFDVKKLSDLKFTIAKAASTGFLTEQLGLIFFISFILTCLGGLIYIIPLFWDGPPGIKHNGIFHSGATNRGAIGIVMAVLLIGFYIVLYWYPYLMTNWVIMLDPLANALTGSDASQWFLYGFMYCLAMIVMGVRMYAKYRGNRYQMVRTTSVLVFQIGFAFLIPNILQGLNNPLYIAGDLKNIWPLDYTFFFDYRLDQLAEAGTLGFWLIGWSVFLVVVGVPLMTFLYGKRWYCSWVCGCGGLAETLGDPYRQLSDKTLKTWKVERWMIHFVLFFVTAMTIAVLYTYFPATSETGGFTREHIVWIFSGLFIGIIALIWGFRSRWKSMSTKALVFVTGGLGLLFVIMMLNHYILGSSNIMFIDSYTARGWYGFMIGSAFAGVVGTGFYPVMGNRAWCRFGCPLAAYFGIIQRMRSRFRITTNGGQCISCGNCSTYCEMGIDVRAYAQRGQNIVRSSCVGCGVCSAVCPRGVLKLENGPDNDNRINENPLIIGNDGIRMNPNVTDIDKRA